MKVELKDFRSDVLALSRRRRLTVASVAQHTGVTRQQAERWLDDMCRDGLLDLEIDEDQAITFYRVVGGELPDEGGITAALAPIGERMVSGASRGAATAKRFAAPRRDGHKSLVRGFLLGFFLPGVGLVYSAPYSAVLAGTAALALALWLYTLPLVGIVALPLLVALAVASGAAGIFYANAYNKQGKRTHIHRGLRRRSS